MVITRSQSKRLPSSCRESLTNLAYDERRSRIVPANRTESYTNLTSDGRRSRIVSTCRRESYDSYASDERRSKVIPSTRKESLGSLISERRRNDRRISLGAQRVAVDDDDNRSWRDTLCVHKPFEVVANRTSRDDVPLPKCTCYLVKLKMDDLTNLRQVVGHDYPKWSIGLALFSLGCVVTMIGFAMFSSISTSYSLPEPTISKSRTTWLTHLVKYVRHMVT